jgi:nucleotide-binding universal stress UspA family protein
MDLCVASGSSTGVPGHVLVGFDGSPLSRAALEHAVSTHPDATLTVLNVVDPVGVVYESETRGLPEAATWYDRELERSEGLLEEAAALVGRRAPERDLTTATEVGPPARTILEYVDSHGVDHVVVGSHGRTGGSRLVFGSVAETVIRRSPVPVTVVR